MFQNITAEKLHELHLNGDVTLVDVRSEAEVARGIIAGALHVPLHALPTRVAQLDNTRPLVLYCHAGGRSAQGCLFLAGKGFREVYNLQGGILAWLSYGFPLDSRPG
ncbi:MAG: rhodanese-like domain-containing protein [Pseudomonadota bacterium]